MIVPTFHLSTVAELCLQRALARPSLLLGALDHSGV